MNSRIQRLALTALLMLVLLLTACGGGGSSSSVVPPGGGIVIASPQITNNTILPEAVQGKNYSFTLTATGGRAPLRWSIAPLSPTAAFVDGLAIDASTGVLSGTANFLGNTVFTATVADADSRTSSANLVIGGVPPLSAPTTKSGSFSQFQDTSSFSVGFQGGVPPFAFGVAGGSLPPGLRLDPKTGFLIGTPLTVGSFLATATIQDSFQTPETVTEQISIDIVPEALRLEFSLPSRLPVNATFSGRIVANGGIPPYSFSLRSGAIPAGLGPINPATGTISGVPTASSFYLFTAAVTDSSSPAQTALLAYGITVSTALGRNDSVTTATPIGNGAFDASISPYIDPPNKAPLPADSDYYKLVSLSGATVHLATQAKVFNSSNPLDTVLEVVDGNGVRLANCRQPDDTGTVFNSACINDDVSSTLQDSSIDFLVPGAPGTPTTFFVHVLDWRGDARPDMGYTLNVSGVTAP